MFTGIVEELGTITALSSSGIRVRAGRVLLDSRGGDSIAVDGVCLTVTEHAQEIFTADISPETRARTTLGRKRVGDRVNLERALRLQDRLGGHLTLGHVDGIGQICQLTQQGEAFRMTVDAPPELMCYIAMKGSIALNGISLTIAGLMENHFEIALIPHTIRQTTLQFARVGDLLNIEVDLLSRYVERLLFHKPTSDAPLNEEFLARHGFL